MIYDQNDDDADLRESDVDSRQSFIALLAALGIVEVTYMLSGGGDSGECELERVVYGNGRREIALPSIPIGFSNDGTILLLGDVLENIAEEEPDGDWVNNEGGHGTVSFYPMEPGASSRIVCDMSYGDDGEEEDEDFDDLFDDVDLGEENDPGPDLAAAVLAGEFVQ